HVAVKLLHAQLSEDRVARNRFVRELAAIERIAGFCTAQVFEADVDGDRPYIVSEFVPGPSLQELVRESGPRTEGSLMRLAVGTATALTAIHRAGIVHRDFKPPNVLMGPDGPRVIDFGIARALDNMGRTLTGNLVGTPAYMAPEQFTENAAGPAADLFSWGATMVFAATGRSPFGGGQVFAVMHRIRFEQPDLSALPPELLDPVRACLAKDPSIRPTSDELLWALLDQTPSHTRRPPDPPATGDLTVPPFTGPPSAAQPARRGAPLVVALILASLLSLLDLAALFVAAGKPADTAMAARFLVLAAIYTGLGVVTLFGVVATWRGHHSGIWAVLGSRLARAAVGLASLPFVTVLPMTIAAQAGGLGLILLLLLWTLRKPATSPAPDTVP
ncbi:MAG: serine/threonine-protein kinase, partial [Streptosporangiaceae bacterium]